MESLRQPNTGETNARKALDEDGGEPSTRAPKLGRTTTPDTVVRPAARAPAKARYRKALVAALVVMVLLIGAYAVWRLFLSTAPVAPNVVEVSGRIEGNEAVIASKTAGKVLRVDVREGDAVTAGQIVAVLDDEQMRAREQQAQAALEQAEARGRRAFQQLTVLGEQLRQSELSKSQSSLDAEGRVSQAQAQASAAEADLARAEADEEHARYEAERLASLWRSGDMPERAHKQAQSAAKAQAAVVAALRQRVKDARAAVSVARAALMTPRIHSSEASLIKQQMLQAEADIEAAQAEIRQARARLEEARAARNDLNVVAPFAGTVTARLVEPGEVVAPGAPLVEIINLSEVYMRGFVPEGEIGRVRTGQPARVYLDSSPHTPLEAVVSQVDSEASFTPENTYFRDDRVRQVVGVKLQLRAPGGFAKPGMPADGEVLVAGDAWASPGRR